MTQTDEPITYNGKNVDDMTREELVAMVKELASKIEDLAHKAESLVRSYSV